VEAMADVKYLCPGSCGKIISEEDFNRGNNVCDSENCRHSGKPLVMKMFCPTCDVYYDEAEVHECE
jgi:hypothetical protein